MTDTRLEHDLLGERAVPAEACYGVHTLGAQENSRIAGTSTNMNANEVVCHRALQDAVLTQPRIHAAVQGELAS